MSPRDGTVLRDALLANRWRLLASGLWFHETGQWLAMKLGDGIEPPTWHLYFGYSRRFEEVGQGHESLDELLTTWWEERR